jgi:ABC-2 type transport system ATP-binding protein
VDPRNRRDFWAQLFELADAGTTILVSTHYMDEAERCHRLAILHHGVKVADGAPADLQASTGMWVIEVLADSPRQAHLALLGLENIRSVTQLGIRLRVLIPDSQVDPVQTVRACLEGRGITANISLVPASLEDVFVATTLKPGSKQ